jgi:hypothetical protein
MTSGFIVLLLVGGTILAFGIVLIVFGKTK